MTNDELLSIHSFGTQNPYEVSHEASKKFIESLDIELKDGLGFVPFIGAGLSAPSGIPLIREIREYLRYCISLSLGIIAGDSPFWSPRKGHWPPFREAEKRTEKGWLNLVRTAMDDLPDERWEDHRVYQEAIGAMAEWRTSLLFLSRIVHEIRPTKRGHQICLLLDAPKQEVINAGIREIMRGKHPTLGHRMLASLGGVLRLDLILTTNFDDLLEDAFQAAKNTITPFSLQLRNELPDYAALASQRSLVKLHGDRQDLRADYTLDEIPSNEDLWRFVDYLLTAEGREQHSHGVDKNHLAIRNHLLVMGFSASERRTLAMIEHAWLSTSDKFKVFWICHTQQDVDSVAKFTYDVKRKYEHSFPTTPWNGKRSCVLRHTHLGLLFLQVFQTLRHSIPIRGVVFPSTSRLSIPPLKPNLKEKAGDKKEREIRRASLIAKLREHMDEFAKAGFKGYRLIVVTSHKGVEGLTTACSDFFDEQQSKNDCCLWIEMNGVSSTDDLFEQLLDAANFTTGAENWMPVFVENDPRSRSEEFRRIMQSSGRPWTIFLNARERPGANLDAPTSHTAEHLRPPNGWLDDETSTIDESATTGKFLELLAELCGPKASPDRDLFGPLKAPPCTIVLLTSQKAENGSENNKAQKEHNLHAAIRRSEMVSEIVRLEHSCVGLVMKDCSGKCMKWVISPTDDDKERGRNYFTTLATAKSKLRFLNALVQMQCTRFLSSIWTDAFRERTQEMMPTEEWLRDLELNGLLRRKLGGFVWLHADVRNELRYKFSNLSHFLTFFKDVIQNQKMLPSSKDRKAFKASKKQLTKLTVLDTTDKLSEIHGDLAVWYRRVLAAADAPPPLFEAIYHALKAAVASLEYKNNGLDAERWVAWAAALLHSHEFLVQTRGYSRGSCRRLQDIRERWLPRVDELVNQLEKTLSKDLSARIKRQTFLFSLQCVNMMRAIAREVGEYGKGYLRLRASVFETLYHICAFNAPLAHFTGDNPPASGFSQLYLGRRTDVPYSQAAMQDALSDTTVKISKEYYEAVTSLSPGSASPLEWLRFCRWKAMLGLASRSYKEAFRSALYGIVFACSQWQGEGKYRSYHELQQLVRSLIDKNGITPILPEVYKHLGSIRDKALYQASVQGNDVESDRARFALETARLAELVVDGYLLYLNLDERTMNAPGTTPQYSSDLPPIIHATLALIDDGISLSSQHVSQHYGDFMLLRSRMLMHLSVYTTRGHLEWSTAMQYLTDAEACLAAADAKRYGSDHAIIELFRAEVSIHRALTSHVRIQTKDNKTFFASLRYEVKPDADDATLSHSKGEAKRQLHFIYDLHKSDVDEETQISFRKVRSLLQDALRFLDRAESLLTKRRRNVAWTTWYFHRRMQVIAGLIWASIIEKGSPIPFLGPEAAPIDCKSQADQLLEDSFRMIRQDPYRLATIVDEYASCAAALHVRLLLDPMVGRMPNRQGKMRKALKIGLERLIVMHELRKTVVTNDADHHLRNSEIDNKVSDYVEAVVDRTNTLLKALDVPFVVSTDRRTIAETLK